MKISIILPIYNVEEYLTRCLDSLLGQTLQDIEIICVNDASPDNCSQILKQYSSSDPRVRVITHNKNAGAGTARQSGLNIATGEYVGFVDPDDYVEPDFFETLYKLAIQSGADIVKGAVQEIDLQGQKHKHGDNFNEIISNNKLKFHGQYLWDAIYNMQMIRKHNIRFHIDIFCFGLQAAFFANKIATTNKAFYNYVRRTDSCDSEVFSINKWVDKNVRGAQYYLEFVNSHDYNTSDYIDIVTDFIYPLYFYGYDKLCVADRLCGAEQLAQFLIEFNKNVKHQEIVSRVYGEYTNSIISGDATKLKKQLLRRGMKIFWTEKLRRWLFN